MKNCLSLFVFLVLFSFNCKPLEASNFVSVNHFTKEDHGGGNQNWDLSIDAKGRVYVANNDGLVVYDGSLMRLFPLPVPMIIRSVRVIGDRIYTGSFEEFGFWEYNIDNQLVYTSLIPLLSGFTFHNEEIWKIVEKDNQIYFHSFGTIFCLSEEHLEAIPSPGLMQLFIPFKDRIFTQQIGGSLYELVNKQFVRLQGSEIFSNTEVKAIIEGPDGAMLVGTNSMGLFLYKNDQFRQWQVESSAILRQSNVNNGLRIGDKMILGTILNGIFILNSRGEITSHLNSSNSIQNNTILALHADKSGQLWVAMDKGFDYVGFSSPIEVYRESDDNIGMSYTAAQYKGFLYVGTNQGVYYYPKNLDGTYGGKQFLANSQGQVWFLNVIDDRLYCGMNNGTYLINNQALEKVSEVSGGFNLLPAGNEGEALMLQSSYSFLTVFRKKNGVWRGANLLDGFSAPSRYLAIDPAGLIFVGRTIKGLFILEPDADWQGVTVVSELDKTGDIRGPLNKVFKVDNRIIVPTGKNMVQWDPIHQKLIPFPELDKALGDFRFSDNIIPVSNDRYWFIHGKEIALFSIRFAKSQLLYRCIPETYGVEMVDDNENIVEIEKDKFILCMENGFALLVLPGKEPSTPVAPVIHQVMITHANQSALVLTPWKAEKKLGTQQNNLVFSFASAGAVGQKTYFKLRCDGFDTSWSAWTSEASVEYKRLPPGKYSFQVKSMNEAGLETPITALAFEIANPIYLTLPAYLVYFVLSLVFILLVRINYKRRRWRHKEQALKLENEKMRQLKEKAEAEMIKVANEKLQSEMSLKDMELAKNTMSIIRKNEALIEIREALEKQKEELGYRLPNKYFDSIIRLIDKNLSNDHDWEIFETHFDQAHENFFRKLKATFPELTPHDLRLCAYLKLNLSSKEIAPLLNISIRGVEEKRYRLRKRLNLTGETSLTEFIMNFG